MITKNFIKAGIIGLIVTVALSIYMAYLGWNHFPSAIIGIMVFMLINKD